jgi:hypothetical protein
VGISSLPDPPAMNQPAEVGCHSTPAARPVMDQRFRYRKSFRKSSTILLNSSGLSMFGTRAVPCIMALRTFGSSFSSSSAAAKTLGWSSSPTMSKVGACTSGRRSAAGGSGSHSSPSPVASLPRVANPAFLSDLLFSGLLCVAPYCVRGGIKVVSTASFYSPNALVPL